MVKSIYRLNDLDLRLAEAGPRRLPDGEGLYFKRSKGRPGTGSFELRF
jgi:hypothetical protein